MCDRCTDPQVCSGVTGVQHFIYVSGVIGVQPLNYVSGVIGVQPLRCDRCTASV